MWRAMRSLQVAWEQAAGAQILTEPFGVQNHFGCKHAQPILTFLPTLSGMKIFCKRLQ